MKQEDIFKAADETDTKWDWSVDMDNWLICFANMIAAAEREACAKVCDEIENEAYATYRKNYDSYAEGFSAGALACLEAIKARSEK